MVIWGGKFDRTPMGENRKTVGRDFHLSDVHGKIVKEILA